jgi:VanZ family protein
MFRSFLTHTLPVLLWLAWIFYVSLQPLPSALLPEGVSRAVAESLPGRVSINDAGHMLEFAVLGALLLRWSAWRFAGQGWRRILLIALVAAALAALADETIQHFTPGRAFELDDIALDFAAAMVGAVIGVRIQDSGAKRHSSLLWTKVKNFLTPDS